MVLELRNPHAVLEILKKRPQDLIEVQTNSHHSQRTWSDVIQIAKERGCPVSVINQRQRRHQKSAHPKSGRVSATKAIVKEHPGVSLDTLFQSNLTSQSEHKLWLALDQIQDPQNVGAIFRTAAFFGVQGIVITKDRSAPMNATVYDVASGGVESVPFIQQTNLSRAIELAKQAGLWVLGTSEHAEAKHSDIESDRAWLLVLGNEEKGLRRLTQEKCDLLCRIPAVGEIMSLNVSVAAGVLISHFAHQ